jgi:uncharacterized RDD family membrane protein YckC
MTMLIKRFLAALIDSLLLAMIAFPLIIIMDTNNYPIGKYVGYYLILFSVVYSLLCEIMYNRTLGKYIMGLKVRTINGDKPSTYQIILRNVLRIIDHGIFFGVALIFFTKKHQRIGDIFSKTIVSNGRNFS